jgi:hypothetical protein
MSNQPRACFFVWIGMDKNSAVVDFEGKINPFQKKIMEIMKEMSRIPKKRGGHIGWKRQGQLLKA